MNYPFNKPQNEPVLDYEPGSPKKNALKLRIKELKSENIVAVSYTHLRAHET